MSTLVADAGPLIFLAKLGRLNLLYPNENEVFIPNAVMSENLDSSKNCQKSGSCKFIIS